MRTNYLFSLLALTSLSLVHLHAEDPAPDEPCGSTPKPMRVTTRHIEGNGIGYNKGYTTIEGFFAPYKVGNWTPFLDVRGHVLNDGQLAANAGLGARYLTDSRIWGMNTYYDYRNSNHQHYNQVALGLESLGKIWDFRVNGYLPVGDKTSSSYDWDFDKYVGYNILLKGKREFAMKGLSSEAGFHIDHFKKLPIYFAAGPYYLEGKGKNVWGGQLRGALDLAENIRLEGNTSYDNVFKWVGQGQVSLIIPFGHKKKVNQTKDRSCSTALALEKRALQKVDRFEIIPVSRERRTALAVDPATGQTQVVFHVDPSGNSNGTAASPFHTVSAALALAKSGDRVLVQPGRYDAANENLDNGFIASSGILLSSSSISQTVATQYGRMSLPVTTSPAVLTNSRDNTDGLTRILNIGGDNVTVSGISFVGSDVAAAVSSQNPVGNAYISQNTFTIASQNGDCSAIDLEVTGISSIFKNAIIGVESLTGSATGIACTTAEGSTHTIISKNRVFGVINPSQDAHSIKVTGLSGAVTMASNTATGPLSYTNLGDNSISVTGNTLADIETSQPYMIQVWNQNGTLSSVVISINKITNCKSSYDTIGNSGLIYVVNSSNDDQVPILLSANISENIIDTCQIAGSSGSPDFASAIYFTNHEQPTELTIQSNEVSYFSANYNTNGIYIYSTPPSQGSKASIDCSYNTLKNIKSLTDSVYQGSWTVSGIHTSTEQYTNNSIEHNDILSITGNYAGSRGIYVNTYDNQAVINNNHLSSVTSTLGHSYGMYVYIRPLDNNLDYEIAGNTIENVLSPSYSQGMNLSFTSGAGIRPTLAIYDNEANGIIANGYDSTSAYGLYGYFAAEGQKVSITRSDPNTYGNHLHNIISSGDPSSAYGLSLEFYGANSSLVCSDVLIEAGINTNSISQYLQGMKIYNGSESSLCVTLENNECYTEYNGNGNHYSIPINVTNGNADLDTCSVYSQNNSPPRTLGENVTSISAPCQ